jgi:hypothetical protein
VAGRHAEIGRIMPIISAVCMVISVMAFIGPAMRAPITLFAIIGVQVAALLLLLIKWW